MKWCKINWVLALVFLLAVPWMALPARCNGSGGVWPDAVTVSITTGFSPAVVTVTQSGIVTWVNATTQTHMLISDSGEFASGPLAPGESYSMTFGFTGTYSYHDERSFSGEVHVVSQRWQVYLPITMRTN